MVKYTAGPWRVEEGTTLIWGNCDPHDHSSYGMGYPIMDGQHPRSWRRDHPTDDEIEGNCRLVAAAPDMLIALREARDFIATERNIRHQSCIVRGSEEMDQDGAILVSEADARLIQIDAAIAKAEAASP
jgi:hypothetical protein